MSTNLHSIVAAENLFGVCAGNYHAIRDQIHPSRTHRPWLPVVACGCLRLPAVRLRVVNVKNGRLVQVTVQFGRPEGTPCGSPCDLV